MPFMSDAWWEAVQWAVKEADRCRNFFAMGLLYWLYGRELDATLRFLDQKFGKAKPEVAQANEKALWAGWNYGETTEAFVSSFRVDPAKLPAGTVENLARLDEPAEAPGAVELAYSLMARDAGVAMPPTHRGRCSSICRSAF